MAEHSYHEETTRLAVWSLPLPASWGEVLRMVASIRDVSGDALPVNDVLIEYRGGSIRFVFDMSDPPEKVSPIGDTSEPF